LTHSRGAETRLHIAALVRVLGQFQMTFSPTADYTACDMVEIPCGWSYRPGWMNCTSTLPERILSLSTTSVSGSIISRLNC